MSKITFRADEDLVERIEALDASKSEVMREALRSFLEREAGTAPAADAGGTPQEAGSVDDALAARVDQLVAERVEAYLETRSAAPAAATRPRDLNVNVTVEGSGVRGEHEVVEAGTEIAGESDADAGDTDRAGADVPADADADADADGAGPGTTDAARTCSQCGEELDTGHVHCPNCGEKQTHRVFCECGDELRSDWAFCPSCGRRTPAADVLERS